jgi:hypothetical protein
MVAARSLATSAILAAGGGPKSGNFGYREKSLMVKWLPTVAALVLLAGAGAANGLWNDRWRVSHELERMGARVLEVPTVLGDWVGTDIRNEKLTARMKRNGSVQELISRAYANQRTGAVVSLMIATGRPGPISTHNPLTCIGTGEGYEQNKQVVRERVEAGGQTAFFARCDFVRNRASLPEGLRVYWAWYDRQAKSWVDVKDPRIAFASYRALTKIYVSRALGLDELASGQTKQDQADPAVWFLQDALPVINAALFESTTPTGALARVSK